MKINLILPRFSSLGLLLFLVFFFIISPFFSHGNAARVVLDISVILLLILSVYICSFNNRDLVFSGLLAIPALIRLINPSVGLNELTLICNAAFFAFVIFVILRKLFSTKHVTMDVIYAAITIYFLIGVFWGFIYMLLEYFYPGSFKLPQSTAEGALYPELGQDMIYYSFVTLTTVGFGDIHALSQPAKSFSALEAMMGPLYLAVLVARLVGMHISQEKS
jgi:hypothetical protein